MATHAEVKKQMQVFVDRLNDIGPDICQDWGGSVQFVFPDLKTGWLMKFKMDGTVESCHEKVDEKAATGVLELDSDTWVGIITKTINTSEAKASGKVIPRGSIEAIIKISPALM